jgi:hypothetical protein
MKRYQKAHCRIGESVGLRPAARDHATEPAASLLLLTVPGWRVGDFASKDALQ